MNFCKIIHLFNPILEREVLVTVSHVSFRVHLTHNLCFLIPVI